MVAVVGTGLFAAVVAYPCSRFRVVGHYFGLVTLAVGEVIRLLIIAERDWTGGSLGLTLKTAGTSSLLAVQFADRRIFYYGRSRSGRSGSGCGGASTARWRAPPWKRSGRTRRRPPPSAST